MSVAERTTTTVWTGDLQSGHGVTNAESGALTDVQISLPTRVGKANGESSPEELLSAAHSGCLAMNFSGVLTNNGTPPESLTVSSTVGFGPKAGGGFEVKHAHVTITGKVPGMSAEDFKKLAETAEQTCPVSNAIRGNVEITTDITFEG